MTQGLAPPFSNTAPRHWNSCGQAAIASLLAQWRAGMFSLPGPRPAPDAVLDALRKRHGPDLPLGLGTSVWRLVAALRAHALDAECVQGAAAEHVLRAQSAVGRWSAVLLDDGMMGGLAFSAHWATLMSCHGDEVQLANARHEHLDWPRFRSLWRCRFLPPPHRFCAVIVHGRTGEDPA